MGSATQFHDDQCHGFQRGGERIGPPVDPDLSHRLQDGFAPGQHTVVTFADASAADLKPGAPVFVPATKAPDGTLSTAFVVVGNQGVVPPM